MPYMLNMFGYCMDVYALWSLCLQAHSFARISMESSDPTEKFIYMCSNSTFISAANSNEWAECLTFEKDQAARWSATGYTWFWSWFDVVFDFHFRFSLSVRSCFLIRFLCVLFCSFIQFSFRFSFCLVLRSFC